MTSDRPAPDTTAGRPKREPFRVDPGLFVALIICTLAIWPFVSRSSLPQATDAELHIFRVAELGRLVRDGESYPRWAPNFYYGYGYPIFNYYAPLSYYVALMADLLPVWDAVDGAKVGPTPVIKHKVKTGRHVVEIRDGDGVVLKKWKVVLNKNDHKPLIHK